MSITGGILSIRLPAVIALPLALTTACTPLLSLPKSVPGAAEPTTAFECATARATGLGFRMVAADREMRFANLEREAPATGLSAIGGFTIVDHLAVRTTAAADGSAILFIDAFGMQHGGSGKPAGAHTRVGASTATELHAFQILQACGVVADSTTARVRQAFSARGVELP